MTIPVTVTAPGITVAITGNGQNNSITVTPGQPVALLATFTGIYIGTAINNSDNTVALTSQSASSPKTYTFNAASNPAAPGSYLFNAVVQTNSSGWANNYGKSFTVNVVASCPNGTGFAGSCTGCNSGYVLQGTAPTNSCVAACPHGTGPAGACTSCNSGYTLSGGNCTVTILCPANCPGTYPSCVANSGYSYNSGANTCTVLTPSIGTFSVSPTRVRKNTATAMTFSYTVTNPPASCTISGPSGFTPITINPVNGVAGTKQANATLSQTSIFTLTCGSVSVQSTVGLIPITQEI
jgi:hypothetical protein